MADKIRVLHLAVGALMVAGCAGPAVVDSGGIEIQQQPLAEALVEWATKTGNNVLVPLCAAAELTSRHVKATDARDALSQLLFGTRLQFKLINARTVAIECPA